MTPSQLRALGLGLYGPDWKSPLARAVGVTARQMRRYAAEETAVPDWLDAKLSDLIGALPRPIPIRDRWIVGEGDEGRVYVLHTQDPRFLARVVEIDGAVAESESAADRIGGDAYDHGDGLMLCEIQWFDGRPTDEVARTLLGEAAEWV